MLTQDQTQRDSEFFKDFSDFMSDKYPDMKEKFGLWKIHQHFEIKEDEVFHETTNNDTKESTLRIIKKSQLPIGAFPTTWKLNKDGMTVATWCCDDCPSKKLGKHFSMLDNSNIKFSKYT